MPEPIIDIRDLTRRFGKFTAVDAISFQVERGEIFGFLGPNGAGKTTTIRMLCTLIRVTAGKATVAGFDVAKEPHEVRQHIGLVFQESSLDDRLTGRENLHFHARLYDIDKTTFKKRSAELLDMVDLADKADTRVRTYSGGMKRRLEIARGLLHHPEVFFLDEPTLGLDPQTRRHIWDYLRSLRNQEGITLLMTTHYIEEAENCDRIAIIDNGKIVALDTPENLREDIGGDLVTVETGDSDRTMEILNRNYDVKPRKNDSGNVVIETRQGGNFVPKIIDTLAKADPPIAVTNVGVRRPTLEDVFIRRTGRAIREAEGNQVKEDMRQSMALRGRN